jgi:hypothetical protein
MGAHTNTAKNACIATALVLLGIGIVGIPTAAADGHTPTVNPDGSIGTRGDCYYIDPWDTPPVVDVDPMGCI